jgi:hypothetical protein
MNVVLWNPGGIKKGIPGLQSVPLGTVGINKAFVTPPDVYARPINDGVASRLESRQNRDANRSTGQHEMC